METSRQQEHQLRRMGREAVTKAIQAANANSGGMRRVTAKVTRVNSDYTVDVDMGDSAYSMPITGLRYTTSCFGIRVGDTVLVDVVGHLATVTGILATADNGPHVNRGWSRLYSSGDQFIAVRVVAGIVFLHANLARPTSGRAYCKIDSSLRPLHSIYLPTFYYGEDHVMGLWVPGKQADDDSIYVYDTAGKAVWLQGIWSWPYEG